VRESLLKRAKLVIEFVVCLCHGGWCGREKIKRLCGATSPREKKTGSI